MLGVCVVCDCSACGMLGTLIRQVRSRAAGQGPDVDAATTALVRACVPRPSDAQRGGDRFLRRVEAVVEASLAMTADQAARDVADYSPASMASAPATAADVVALGVASEYV